VAGLPPADSEAFLAGILERAYQRFARNAPPWAERELLYWPSSLDPRSMLASSFAHADWEHLVFNLFFFVAFAATVEVVVGPLAFAAVGVGASVSSGLFYSLTSAAAGTDIPSLGLSDVVMAMMCLLAFLLPEVRIRCAWWFLLVVGRIALPAWLLALWFVGGDAILLLQDGQAAGGVNLVAHVAGGAFGFVAGALFLQRHKRLAREHATQARLFAPPRSALLR
jgi:membrane associated rhomboid family serine protease